MVESNYPLKQVTIYSIDGRALKVTTSDFDAIPINELKDGNMYFVRTNLNKGAVVKKIINTNYCNS